MSDDSERTNAPEAPPGDGGDRPKTAPAMEAKISELEEAVRQKSEEAARSHDRYVREVAETENFRKRMQRDKAEAIRMANEALLRDVMPVLDNLERAVEHAELGGDGRSVVEGVEMVLRMFADVLERHGVSRVDVAPGTPFDPALHEATDVQVSREVPPKTVLRTQEKGYRLFDRLVRPAKVIVAAAPPEKPD
jgi:molecular chaperone GrpE